MNPIRSVNAKCFGFIDVSHQLVVKKKPTLRDIWKVIKTLQALN